MRVLLTGGAGFIGSHLADKLLQLGHAVDVIDSFNDYYDPRIKRRNVSASLTHPQYHLWEGDILDIAFLQQVFDASPPDMLVHLAARAGVRPSIQQPLLYEQVNVQGTLHLLNQCLAHKIRKVVFASSSSVYGNNSKVPFSEADTVDRPISPYAATKKAGEEICYTYHHLYGLDITCLRFFTVYGPRQRPDMAIHKFSELIYQERPVPIFGDGSSRRDYTFIDDILQGLLASIERCSGYHIYNLGESNTIELIGLVRLLEGALGKKALLDHQPEQAGDVQITFADISLARRELDYRPATPIAEGIARFGSWFLQMKKH